MNLSFESFTTVRYTYINVYRKLLYKFPVIHSYASPYIFDFITKIDI